MNDAPPVIFRHVGEKKFASTRPATTSGSFRVFRGIEEIHEVENTGAVASEFLRVEFKTEPKEQETLKGRFHREAPSDADSQAVQFENAQIRITRLRYSGGGVLRLLSGRDPALLVELRPRAGAHHWVAAGACIDLRRPASGAGEWLRFDFKTAPLIAVRPQDQNR